TVNNQEDTVQEINLNDIDFGSLVSIAQNKQKTHISSVCICKEHGDYLQTIMMIVNNIQEKQDKQTSSKAVSSTSNDEFENVKMLAMLGGSNYIKNAIHSSANNADTSVKQIEIVASIWLNKAFERCKQAVEVP
ncbi:putative leucine-rich repeat-containing protein DDB G0290503 isoform X1, partial [Aphis craccivora]